MSRSTETIQLAIQMSGPASGLSSEGEDVSEVSGLRNEVALAPVDRGFGAWSFVRPLRVVVNVRY